MTKKEKRKKGGNDHPTTVLMICHLTTWLTLLVLFSSLHFPYITYPNKIGAKKEKRKKIHWMPMDDI